MIILLYEGQGKGLMSGVLEYIQLYESTEDFESYFGDGEDYANEEEFVEAQACPGFKLSRKYDTDTDVDFGSLPLDRALMARH